MPRLNGGLLLFTSWKPCIFHLSRHTVGISILPVLVLGRVYRKSYVQQFILIMEKTTLAKVISVPSSFPDLRFLTWF